MAEALAAARAARRAGAAAAGCALVGGTLALNDFLVGVFYDDGLYAGLALALARGLGYAHPHLPGTPAAVHYPPLYPAMLAPLFGLLPLGAAALAAKLLNLLLAALGAGLVAWHAARSDLLGEHAPRWLGPAVVAAAALAIPVLATQAVLFAEPLFAVLLAVAVILGDTPPPSAPDATGSTPVRSAALAGLAAALALLTRSIGVAAGVGIVLYLALVRRAPRTIALTALAPVALAGLGWGVWILAHRGSIDPALAVNYGSYAETLKQAGVSALGTRAPDLPRPLSALTLGWLPGAPLRYVFGVAALGVGLYGLARLARRSAIGFTLIGYLAILAIWPFPPDRFLWAVLPWLALAWAAGAAALWRQARLRVPVAVLAGAVGLGYAVYETRGFAGRWWEGAARVISSNFSELLPGLTTLPPHAVLATDDEALVWLYTRRTAVPFYLERFRGRETIRPTPAEHRAYLERQGVTHVVLASPTSESARELDDLLGTYPGWLTMVHRWPGGRAVFVVNRER